MRNHTNQNFTRRAETEMEAINFFQSFFTSKDFSSTRFSRGENQLAHALLGKGREFAEIAEAELKNGDTTLKLVKNEMDAKLKRELARIAMWHYRQASNRFRTAANQFEQAAKIWQSAKRQKLIKSNAEQMLDSVKRAESAIEFLAEI